MSAQKPTLRSLAVAAGIFKSNNMEVYKMQVDDLLKELEKKFPGISDLDEGDVKDLIADVEKKGGGSADAKEDEKPAGRGRRGAAKEEPEEKPAGRGRRGAAKDEPAEEEKPARGRRGAAKKEEEEPAADEPKPRGRRGAAKEEEPDEKADPEPSRRGGRRGAAKEEGTGQKDASSTDAAAEAAMALLNEILGTVKAVDKRLREVEAAVEVLGKTADSTADDILGLLEEVHAGVDTVTFQVDLPKKVETLAQLVKANSRD